MAVCHLVDRHLTHRHLVHIVKCMCGVCCFYNLTSWLVDKMPADKLSVDKMPVDKMSIEKNIGDNVYR